MKNIYIVHVYGEILDICIDANIVGQSLSLVGVERVHLTLWYEQR